MKYELMRAYYNTSRKVLVLDLYNMYYDKNVELHYYLCKSDNGKIDIKSVMPKLDYKIMSRDLHTLDQWDSLIKTIPNERS